MKFGCSSKTADYGNVYNFSGMYAVDCNIFTLNECLLSTRGVRLEGGAANFSKTSFYLITYTMKIRGSL